MLLRRSAARTGHNGDSRSAALARRMPFAAVYQCQYLYRRLQVLAWPDAVQPAVARTLAAYSRVSGARPGTHAFEAWRVAYERYLYCEQPALMAALWLTAYPDRLDRHVTYRGRSRLALLDGRPAVIALSRTGMSHAALWMLARAGRQVAIVTDPSTPEDQVWATIQRWGEDVDKFTVIPADRRSLLRVRNALRDGRSIVLYPESRTGVGRQTGSVPFMRWQLKVPFGAALIAARFDVPLLPVCAYSTGRRVTIEIAEPLRASEFEDVPHLNHALFRVLSAWVAEHPEQWVGWEYLAQERA